MPDLALWGWQWLADGSLVPYWTGVTSDDAYKKLQQTCNCGEKNNCLKSNCSCKDTSCLPFCKCRGLCTKDIQNETASDNNNQRRDADSSDDDVDMDIADSISINSDGGDFQFSLYDKVYNFYSIRSFGNDCHLIFCRPSIRDRAL